MLRAATEHHELCVGDLNGMRTDTKGLLDAGLALSRGDVGGRARPSSTGRTWTATSAHQISQVLTDGDVPDAGHRPRPRAAVRSRLRGNIGPASVPFTLAGQVETLQAGDRVLLMGIGSGLNVCCTELAW